MLENHDFFSSGLYEDVSRACFLLVTISVMFCDAVNVEATVLFFFSLFLY